MGFFDSVINTIGAAGSNLIDSVGYHLRKTFKGYTPEEEASALQVAAKADADRNKYFAANPTATMTDYNKYLASEYAKALTNKVVPNPMQNMGMSTIFLFFLGAILLIKIIR